MKLLILFIGLSIVNVILATVKSILTVKGTKVTASLINGIYFAYYNIVLIYTVADFPMWEKCLITFICNLIGVYIVKWAEERAKKDKLWKVELTTNFNRATALHRELKALKIPHNYSSEYTGKYAIFNIYCGTQKESSIVREIADRHKAKYFVSESKEL